MKIHLLCNAHIDPVWMWKRNEGLAEAVSTFRVAADFCEKYDGFVFNHNESLLYQWVEEREPELFCRIQRLVSEGKWHIIGGFYLQADSNVPSGESFIRQIRTGQRYFNEKFGKRPAVAFQADPFGHTRGLVQILKKAGYGSYIFMRPYGSYKRFLWEGFDGSRIIAQRIFKGYNTLKGKALNRIKDFIKENPEADIALVPWGIGNHGGGASEEDMKTIAEFCQGQEEHELIHSFAESFFDEAENKNLEVITHSLTHTMVGCYTSMHGVKKLHRSLENNLCLCEKMLAHAGMVELERLREAEECLLFNEFHDILPGTMIREAEKESKQQLCHGLEIVQGLMDKAFFELCRGQKQGNAGEIPILVYNPHPFEVEADVECTFTLENQNWDEGEFTLADVYDTSGRSLLAQNEIPPSSLNIDWCKKVAFRARLAPMQVNRFDCKLRRVKGHLPVQKWNEIDAGIVMEGENSAVVIDKKSGLISSYKVDNVERVLPGSGKIGVFEDNEDPWGMTVDSFTKQCGEFVLASTDEAKEIAGCRPIEVIENGSVRMKVQAVFVYSRSYAVVTYTLSKNENELDVHIKMYAVNINRMFKYCISTTKGKTVFLGQTAFGTQELEQDCKEVCFQKWCGLKDADGLFAVFNDSMYGGSGNDGEMQISLCRTPVYSAHPVEGRPLIPAGRAMEHIDMGENEFVLRLAPDSRHPDRFAQQMAEDCYRLAFFPQGGTGNIENKELLTIIQPDLILSALYLRQDGKYVFRIYNSSAASVKTQVCFKGNTYDCVFGAYEFKTYCATESDCREITLQEEFF